MSRKNKSATPRHPLQPLAKDKDGVVRFKPNAIVRFLLDAGLYDLNKLALMNWPNEDREQFAQLIGYSLSGFGELSYVSDEACSAAEAAWEASQVKQPKKGGRP